MLLVSKYVRRQHVSEKKTGCPGSGKGTLVPEIARQKGFRHVSVGDELRRYVKSNI